MSVYISLKEARLSLRALRLYLQMVKSQPLNDFLHESWYYRRANPRQAEKIDFQIRLLQERFTTPLLTFSEEISKNRTLLLADILSRDSNSVLYRLLLRDDHALYRQALKLYQIIWFGAFNELAVWLQRHFYHMFDYSQAEVQAICHTLQLTVNQIKHPQPQQLRMQQCDLIDLIERIE